MLRNGVISWPYVDAHPRRTPRPLWVVHDKCGASKLFLVRHLPLSVKHAQETDQSYNATY